VLNTEQFVAGLKIAVHDGAIQSVLATLEQPGGRKPPERLADLSRWYHSLALDDRSRVDQVIGLAVHAGVFGFLCVLDGVRPITDGSAPPKLELQAVEAGRRSTLNGSGEQLHDLYQRAVVEAVFGGAAA